MRACSGDLSESDGMVENVLIYGGSVAVSVQKRHPCIIFSRIHSAEALATMAIAAGNATPVIMTDSNPASRT